MRRFDSVVLDVPGLFAGQGDCDRCDPAFLRGVLESISAQVSVARKIAYVDFGKYTIRRFDPSHELGMTTEAICYDLFDQHGWRVIYSPTISPAKHCVGFSRANAARSEVLVLSGDCDLQRSLPLEATFVWVYSLYDEIVLRFL